MQNGDSSKEMGSSPQGSFEHEMLRFMQMNVSRKRRKSRSKSPSHGNPTPPLQTPFPRFGSMKFADI
jgi:hypothetical protein